MEVEPLEMSADCVLNYGFLLFNLLCPVFFHHPIFLENQIGQVLKFIEIIETEGFYGRLRLMPHEIKTVMALISMIKVSFDCQGV